jgi:hypothetical protein
MQPKLLPKVIYLYSRKIAVSSNGHVLKIQLPSISSLSKYLHLDIVWEKENICNLWNSHNYWVVNYDSTYNQYIYYTSDNAL